MDVGQNVAEVPLAAYRFGTLAMLYDRLAQDLYAEICHIPLIAPHSHIDAHRPAARSLDEILGYHYYTELAHSAGMPAPLVDPGLAPRARARNLAEYLDR